MREIDAAKFLEIMRKNTDFELVETPLGTCVEMDWVDAFCFSYCTDSRYLTSLVLPFTPGMSMLQLTNEALSWNIAGGNVFDGQEVRNSPLKWGSEPDKRHLFSGDKLILPVESNSQAHIKGLRRRWIRELESDGDLNPTDFVIIEIDTSKKGNGMEKFLEYMSCLLFKSRGWVVDNQLTLGHSIGTPDFYAFREEGCEEGYFLVELLLRFAGHTIGNVHREITESVVGEAKTGTTRFEGQLRKYLDTGYFNKGLGLLPMEKDVSPDVGLLHFDEGGGLVFQESGISHAIGSAQRGLLDWFADLQTCYQMLNGDEAGLLSFIASRS